MSQQSAVNAEGKPGSDLPFVAVDPFRPRRVRWRRRPLQDLEQGGSASAAPSEASQPSENWSPARQTRPSHAVSVDQAAHLSGDIDGEPQPTKESSKPSPVQVVAHSSTVSGTHQSRDIPQNARTPSPSEPALRGQPRPRHQKRSILVECSYLRAWADLCADLYHLTIVQLYLCLYLRLPHLYFYRMAGVFELSYLNPHDEDFLKILWKSPTSLDERMRGRIQVRDGNLVPSLIYFKAAWEQHLENLMQEWKTMNIISGLILPAATTLLQIDAAAADPVVRTTALLALVCALISMLYGCLYIASFNLMKAVHRTYPWIILLNRNPHENVLWNAWIIVAMPAIWLCWSIISFLVCIVGFVWVAGTRDEVTEPMTTYRQALASRVVITVTVALGVIYFVLVIQSFMRYSRKDPDSQWRDEVRAAPGYKENHQIANDDA